MKIKLHSQYDHFPNCQTDGDDFDLELWNDGKIWEYVQNYPNVNRGSALLIEPRPLQEVTYELVEKHYEMFDSIFTHDSQLLGLLPNACKILYWRDYELNDEPKDKLISFICGNKEMCAAHRMRMKLAEKLKNKVDVLGDWNGGQRVSIHDAYAPYKYAIVIEKGKLVSSFFNGFLYATCSCVIIVMVVSCAAFVISRNHHGVNKILYFV